MEILIINSFLLAGAYTFALIIVKVFEFIESKFN